MIHDRDMKFARRADNVLGSTGGRVILTPLMATRANAYAERWIGSCRRECLDWVLIVNERDMQAVLEANHGCRHLSGAQIVSFQVSVNLRRRTSGSEGQSAR
ncbi:MAG TPA: hypothetical protein VKE27_03115 [Candidatus Dormibacteraeota bacterium]|nr:hypothetical protein [Candidatus Dormibacteraeota bacterium]